MSRVRAFSGVLATHQVALTLALFVLSICVTAYGAEIRALLRDRPLRTMRGFREARRMIRVRRADRMVESVDELVIGLAYEASTAFAISMFCTVAGFTLLDALAGRYKSSSFLTDQIFNLAVGLDGGFLMAVLAVIRVVFDYRKAKERSAESR